MARSLVNIGNTCSINSLLQCIAHSRVLRRFLTEYQIEICHDGRWSLTAELAGLVRKMWDEDGGGRPIAPRQLLEAFFEKARFLCHGEQHDICEVWMVLCENVAKECSSPKVLKRYNVTAEEARIWRERHGDAYAKAVLQYSKTMKSLNKNTACMWLELIQGVLIAQVTCKFCGMIYHNFEPFTTLDLDIPHDGATMEECLQAFFRGENLSDWKCDKCGRTGEAEKVIQFWKLPAVLCLSLRRFVHTPDGNLMKNRAAVKVPNNISVSVVGPQQFMGESVLKYKLSSIGLHHGCLNGGHYTAIGEEGGKMHWFDDDIVRSDATVPSSDVYLMFYDINHR